MYILNFETIGGTKVSLRRKSLSALRLALCEYLDGVLSFEYCVDNGSEIEVLQSGAMLERRIK